MLIAYSILLATLALQVFSIIALISISGQIFHPIVLKQVSVVLLSFFSIKLMKSSSISYLYKNCVYIYYISMLFILATELFGLPIMGAKRWVNLGICSIQPTEIAKVSIILVLAKYYNILSSSRSNIFFHFIVPSFFFFSNIIYYKAA